MTYALYKSAIIGCLNLLRFTPLSNPVGCICMIPYIMLQLAMPFRSLTGQPSQSLV